MADGPFPCLAHKNSRFRLTLFLSLLVFTGSSFGQKQPGHLQNGIRYSDQIARGEERSFDLSLRSRQYAEVEVTEATGLDLAVSILDAHNKLIVRASSQVGDQRLDIPYSRRSWLQTMTLPFIATSEGIYRIKVDSRDSQINASFEIAVQVRIATATDREQEAAMRNFFEGERFSYSFREGPRFENALSRFQLALNTFRKAGDAGGEADSLMEIGHLFVAKNDNAKASEWLERAVLVLENSEDRARLAIAYWYLAGAYHAMRLREKAIAEFDRAVETAQVAGDRRIEAFMRLRYAYSDGDLARDEVSRQRIIDRIETGTRILHDTGTPADEAAGLMVLAYYYRYIGAWQNAIDTLNRVVDLLRPLHFRSLLAFNLLRIGEIYFDRGDYQHAYDYYGEAYEYSRGMDNYYEAYALYNLGNSSLTFDKHKVAEYLTRALPMWRQNNNGEAYTLTSLGRLYFLEGDLQKALLTYTKALPVMESSGDKYGVGIILSLIGETYYSLGDRLKASDFYDKALELHRSTLDSRDEARTLIKLGDVYIASGEAEKARSHYYDALKIFIQTGNRSGEANAHFAIARLERSRGNISEALSQVEETLKIVESLRADISGTELRSAYFASVQQYYEFYVDILMSIHEGKPNEGFDRRALEAAERGRARSLLELLASSQADLRAGIDKQALEKEAELQKQLNAKAAEQVQLLSGKHTDEQAAAVEHEIEELTTALESLRGRINEANPEFATLSRAQTLHTSEIQSLLDDDTLLLEYKLGEQRSFLWIISSGEIKTNVLPKRATLENSAREVYLLLNARNLRSKGETIKQASERVKLSDESFREASLKLGQQLFGQVRSLLGKKRLVIVGDGALQYIPFGALPVPNAAPAGSNAIRRLMLADHEIVYLPSASSLGALRREAARRPPPKRTLAVLADPVFSAMDPRVVHANGGRPNTGIARKPLVSFSTQRALSGLDLGGQKGIPRLPFSRREADAITGLLPASDTLKALDFSASVSKATSPELSHYGIIHFATHGLLNSAHPELSGLLFSLVNERGEPENGFLPLQSIYRMKLNADLVVLSACQTGLGKEVSGEGLIGLTRGFMYAGTSRVVASLWKVDDAATAELMENFYRAMLQEHLSPSAALRKAQLELLQNSNWKQPYFWGAFTIQGEWKK